MKRPLSLLVFSFYLLVSLLGSLQAQTPMNVPYGSFEQWTAHSGYNVSVMGMSMPVYSDYSTPTGWGYLSYPINESYSLYGSTINVNTSLPLIKVSQESGNVPDGNKAVKLQTFMLSDLVSGLVYVMMAPMLDSTLIQTVFPSILATGTANMDSLLALATILMANPGQMVQSLLSLASADFNHYITGGIALNDFLPASLTGSYKYHSGDTGDNGGVMLLGTRYNTTTQRREVVGGGYNLLLTEANAYTPFNVDYHSLHDLDSSFAEQSPDSIVVVLVSSANQNRQQGSYLCVDNLVLWPDTTTVTPPDTTVTPPDTTIVPPDTTDVTHNDTCASVLGLELVNVVFDAFPEYEMEWWGSSVPDRWEVEYGPQGFELGTGTMAITQESAFYIYELEQQGVLRPNTWYDFYVRSVCNDTVYGDWDSVQYRTFCATVDNLMVLADSVTVNAAGLLEGYKAVWTDTTDTQEWYVEYCLEGTPEWGTCPFAIVHEPQYSLPPLQPNQRYVVTVQSHCGDNNIGDQRWVYFPTATVGLPEFSTLNSQLSISPNPANGHCVVTIGTDSGFDENTPVELSLYDASGRLLQSMEYKGTPIELTLPTEGVYLLKATTPTGTFARKIINQ